MAKMNPEQERQINSKQETRAKEIEGIKKDTKQYIETIKTNIVEKVTLTTQLKAGLHNVKEDAEKAVTTVATEPVSAYEKAHRVHKTVTQVLTAVKEEGIEPPPPPTSKAILSKLADKPLASLTAAALHPIIQKYLETPIALSNPGDPPTEFEQAYDNLSQKDPLAASVLRTCLLESAADLGTTKEELEKKFPTESLAKNAEREFENDWPQYGLGTFFDTEENRQTVRALYSLDNFNKLMRSIADDIKNNPSSTGLSQERLNQLISEEITNRIVLLFSKLFRRLDTVKSRETFEAIVRKGGMWTNVEVIYTRLNDVMERLLSQASGEEIPAGFTFYQKFSHEKYEIAEREKEVVDQNTRQIAKVKKKIPQYRINPLPVPEQIPSFSKFLHTIKVQVDQMYATREYLHNVRYLLLQQAGDKGFWAQMAGYAEKMRGTDIDNIMLLPDSDIFMAAFRLYVKHLEASFAKYDWRHVPNMFSDDFYSVRNKIEENVSNTLRVMFPGISGKDEWRIEAALSMASGLAKGVFLTEVEIAAWADPHLETKKEGEAEPTYVSFFYNDAAALNALSMIHTILRFQSQGLTVGPLLFMTLTREKSPLFQSWNHQILWEQLEKFKKSFDSGEAVLLPEEGNFLFNFLVNLGRVGGSQTRLGWDTHYAYEGWLQYKDIPGGTGRSFDLEYLESWKALENIGFEALLRFASTVLEANFISETDISSSAYREKEDLFSYLFTKYIQKNSQHTFTQEKQAIKSIITGEIDEQIRKGAIAPPKNDEERAKLIEKALYKRLLYKILTKVICQRMPTKFTRIERDRFSKDGTRAWQKISDKIQETDSDWNEDDMDQAVKDISIVETLIRKRATDLMKKHTSQQKKPSLFDCDVDNYKVEGTTIRDILSEAYKEDTNKDKKIANAVKVWDQINKMQLTDDNFLNAFAYKLENNKKGNYFPFALGEEEFERSFLALRAAGERPLPRRIGDVAKIEQGLVNPFLKYLQTLHQVAASNKHDPEELVKALYEMYHTVDGIHGAYAYEIVYYTARMTINYFKQDTYAKYFLTKWFSLGKPHSLAARAGGSMRGIWEWGTRDIDHFITQLERLALLKKDPYDLRKKPTKGQKPDFEFCGKLLRQETGATKANIALELGLNYGPIAALVILFEWLKDAWQEITGGKR